MQKKLKELQNCETNEKIIALVLKIDILFPEDNVMFSGSFSELLL